MIVEKLGKNELETMTFSLTCILENSVFDIEDFPGSWLENSGDAA